MTTTEKLIASVTTDCLCENEDGTPSDECFDCYEWQKDWVFELLGMWQVANKIDEDDPILIETDRLGWRNASAFKWTTMLDLHSALSLDGGDFRIEWYLENDTLTARRWSHDEPTGTGLFTFTHHRGCDKCGVPVKADVYNEELGFCVQCSNDYFEEN